MDVLTLTQGSFLGECERRTAIRGFVLAECRHAPGQRLRTHHHDEPYISVVVGGAYDEHVRREVRPCTSGTTIFHPSGEQHRDEFGALGALVFNVSIQAGPWARVAELPAEERPTARTLTGAARSLAMQLHREFRAAGPSELTGETLRHAGTAVGFLTARTRVSPSGLTGEDRRLAGTAVELRARTSPIAELAMEGLALALLAECCRGGPVTRGAPPWLSRALEIVADRAPRGCSLGELSHELAVHPVHVARSFRRWVGETLGERTRRLRVEWACARVVESDRPLAAIALEGGFADQAHFCRVFRRHMRMSPSAFRTQRRGSR